MRKKTIIGNWKMNLNLRDAEDLAHKLKNQINEINNVDIAICPPHVYLQAISNILKNSQVKIGAQNMFYKENGAYTGEISPLMLKDLHIDMVIIGHSERRQYFQETNEMVNLKIKAAFTYGLLPILCVGEDLSTREKGEEVVWVKNQLLAGINNLNQGQVEKLIIAYEPIWAIGTGKICNGNDANKIIKMIRDVIGKKYSDNVSEKVKILYGGSIKSSNFNEHIQYQDIDGGLVGRASITSDEFIKIIDLANNVHEVNL